MYIYIIYNKEHNFYMYMYMYIYIKEPKLYIYNTYTFLT